MACQWSGKNNDSVHARACTVRSMVGQVLHPSGGIIIKEAQLEKVMKLETWHFLLTLRRCTSDHEEEGEEEARARRCLASGTHRPRQRVVRETRTRGHTLAYFAFAVAGNPSPSVPNGEHSQHQAETMTAPQLNGASARNRRCCMVLHGQGRYRIAEVASMQVCLLRLAPCRKHGNDRGRGGMWRPLRRSQNVSSVRADCLSALAYHEYCPHTGIPYTFSLYISIVSMDTVSTVSCGS